MNKSPHATFLTTTLDCPSRSLGWNKIGSLAFVCDEIVSPVVAKLEAES